MGQSFTMDQFAGFLAGPMTGVGRPVINKTGLTGKYNFTLNWTPEQGLVAVPGGSMPPPSADSSGPSIFTALPEQLGLKLQASTGRFDVVAVDHVERPSED